jgi:hypothetical protein
MSILNTLFWHSRCQINEQWIAESGGFVEGKMPELMYSLEQIPSEADRSSASEEILHHLFNLNFLYRLYKKPTFDPRWLRGRYDS